MTSTYILILCHDSSWAFTAYLHTNTIAGPSANQFHSRDGKLLSISPNNSGDSKYLQKNM